MVPNKITKKKVKGWLGRMKTLNIDVMILGGKTLLHPDVSVQPAFWSEARRYRPFRLRKAPYAEISQRRENYSE